MSSHKWGSMKQNRNAGGNNNSIISIEDPVISISQIGDINLINSNTVASIDIQGTNEDTPVTIDVLGNDSDADGDSLTITSATNGTNGTVFIVNGEIVYKQDVNYNGTDSFTYTITDGNGGASTGTVDVYVGAVNDAPVAVDDTASTDEDTPVTLDVLGNDTDAEGDWLTITSATNGSNGTVSIVNDQMVYVPDANFNGLDSFTYTIGDGNGGTSTGTVDVTVGAVNDAPVAVDDRAFTNEGKSVIIDVLANDTDADGDSLTIVSTNSRNGTASIVNGQIVYTPNKNFKGIDSFDYTISDGKGGSSSAAVDVLVRPINGVPVADQAVALGNAPVVINVLGNDYNLIYNLINNPLLLYLI